MRPEFRFCFSLRLPKQALARVILLAAHV
jgi:hypothetical protein